MDLLVERQYGCVWHPWQGSLDQLCRFRYIKGRDYHLLAAAAGFLYTQILDRPILDWLSGFPVCGPICCMSWRASTNVLACSANW